MTCRWKARKEKQLNSKKKILATTAACAIAFSGTALTGCSNDAKDADDAEIIQQVNKVHYEPQELYHGMTGLDAINNGKNYDMLVEYIVNTGGTKATDEDDAYWRGADGLTAYTVMDEYGSVLNMEGARDAYDSGKAILGIGAMLPPDADADSLLAAITGTDALDGRADVVSDSGDLSICTIVGEDGSDAYVVSERSNGNNSPAYNVRIYCNGAQKILLEQLGLEEGANVNDVAQAWKSASGKSAGTSNANMEVSASK